MCVCYLVFYVRMYVSQRKDVAAHRVLLLPGTVKGVMDVMDLYVFICVVI